MATQRCPKCGSNNIKHGYRPTHILFKLAFRYNLLCNDCNLEFKGFAIPGTVPRKAKSRRKNNGAAGIKPILEVSNQIMQTPEKASEPISLETASNLTNNSAEKNKNKVKKRVKVKLNRA